MADAVAAAVTPTPMPVPAPTPTPGPAICASGGTPTPQGCPSSGGLSPGGILESAVEVLRETAEFGFYACYYIAHQTFQLAPNHGSAAQGAACLAADSAVDVIAGDSVNDAGYTGSICPDWLMRTVGSCPDAYIPGVHQDSVYRLALIRPADREIEGSPDSVPGSRAGTSWARLLVTLVLLLLAGSGCQPQKVRVMNDTDQDIRLFACEFLNPTYLKPGQTRTITPVSACSVDTTAGYVGCLLLPVEAYSRGANVRVSSAVSTITQSECAKIDTRRAR